MLNTNLNENDSLQLNQSKSHEADIELLVKKAIDGDPDAFDDLIKQIYPKLFKLSFHLTKNKVDAEDLTHDVSLKIAKSMHLFKFNSSFFSWVYRIAVNTSKDKYHADSNRLKRDHDYYQLRALSEDNSQAIDYLSHQELLMAIHRLSKKLRLAVILTYAMGLSHKEVAHVLKCSENSVSLRIHEAKKKLKQLLRD